jgi:hypothetical protein
MVPTIGLEPVKRPFSMLLASGANGVSLPFIARRIANKPLYLQVFYGNERQLWVKKLVQFSCKDSACAKSVQIRSHPESCAKVVQKFGCEILP